MKQIKVKCPSCGDDILIDLDDEFNVVSVEYINKKLSKTETSECLKNNGIEFGTIEK